MEIFSGVLLTGVLLGIVVLVTHELMGGKAGESVRKYLPRSTADDPNPLLGKRGTVVDGGADLVRVRIEGERWGARSVGGAGLPAGTPIRVTAVNGLILDVEHDRDVEEDPGETESAVQTV